LKKSERIQWAEYMAPARARVYVCFSARNIKCLPQTTLKYKKL